MTNPFFDIQPDTKVDGFDIPLWKASAASQMKIDVAVNAEGKVLVLHDQYFPDYLEWIEFDATTGQMDFITAGGKIQGLGMIIHAPMSKYVSKASEVCTICLRYNEVRDMGVLPLVVRNNEGGLHERDK